MKIFISHSTQDKQAIALPLYTHLKALKLDPWIDRDGIQPSDSLFDSINRAIAQSHYAVAIVSPSFIEGEWTNRELRTLDNLRLEKKIKRLFLIYHQITRSRILEHYPLLADDLAFGSDESVEVIAQKIAEVVESKGELERFVRLKEAEIVINPREFATRLPDMQGAFYLLYNLQMDKSIDMESKNDSFVKGLVEKLDEGEKKLLFRLLARELMVNSQEYRDMYDEIVSRFERRSGSEVAMVETSMIESDFLTATLSSILGG